MKSKTTASFNPSNSKLDRDVVKKYLEQHDQRHVQQAERGVSLIIKN